MPADNLEVINRALVLLGQETITSLADTDSVSDACNRLYEPLVVSLFAETDWRFARERVALTESAAPTNRWSKSYLLPTLNTDRCGPPLQFFNTDSDGARPFTAYELVGAKVETDAAALWCLYTKRKAETLWPEHFARFVTYAVAAEIAEPITEKESLGDRFRTIAYGNPSDEGRGGLFKRAMQADTWSDPDPSLLDADDPIADSRWG